MELPFKYIVLCIIRMLNERKMPLVIKKVNLVNYFNEIMKKSYFSIEEKKEIGENFDFEYEVDSLLDEYNTYFEDDGSKIIFDDEYIDELGNLIVDEMNKYDEMLITDIDCVIEGDTAFLDILGVQIKRDLYNYLLNIEKEIEDNYNEMCRLENYVGFAEVDLNPLINKMKSVNMKKTIMLLNTKNLLSRIEQYDLMQYASNNSDNVNENEVVDILYDDLEFSQIDIIEDVFLRSIFTNCDSYVTNLEESLIINYYGMSKNTRYSMIEFYTTFIGSLEKEKEISNAFLQEELINVKYRVMNVLDSVFGTVLFMKNEYVIDERFRENYDFAQKGAYFFAKELLMYDDEKYRNRECDTDNMLIYLNNILKKIFIETYYKLTNDKKIIEMIKENEFYEVNRISSGFLRDIVNNPKIKIKEV